MTQNPQPLLMTLKSLHTVLDPYAKGKKHLMDNINDIWASAIPTPNVVNNEAVKIIMPELWLEFVRLAEKES